MKNCALRAAHFALRDLKECALRTAHCALRDRKDCALRAALLCGLVGLVLPVASVAAQGHALIVVGASGEPRYAKSFLGWATTLHDALVTQHGLPRSNVVLLAEDSTRDRSRIAGRSTKVAVSGALARIARQARAGERVLIVLIGHGSHQGADSRFNLPGPDLSAGELARLLAPLATQQVAVVNAASASGDFVPVLAAKNRIIVTATKSSYERNETVFPRFFVDAMTGAPADADKDSRVSLLEAFTYATREVTRHYESGSRLPTEHAVLDDDGDGKGSASPDPRSGDGAQARRFAFGGVAVGGIVASGVGSDSLQRRKALLEDRIDSLRRRKDSLPAERYERELESLLVDLAQVTQQLRGTGGRP